MPNIRVGEPPLYAAAAVDALISSTSNPVSKTFFSHLGACSRRRQ